MMWAAEAMQYALLSFYKSADDVRLIRQVAGEKRMLLQPQEAHTILSLARMQAISTATWRKSASTRAPAPS